MVILEFFLSNHMLAPNTPTMYTTILGVTLNVLTRPGSIFSATLILLLCRLAQDLRNGCMPLHFRQLQGGPAFFTRNGRICACREQDIHDLCMTLVRRPVQRREPQDVCII